MYQVYVKTDEESRILAANSSAFLSDTTGWTQIDEGDGDRYIHAQGNYFPKQVCESHGIPIYKLADCQAVERTQAEIDGDIANLPPLPPSPEERIAELEAVIDALIGGTA